MIHVLCRVLERQAASEAELARLLSNTIPVLIRPKNQEAQQEFGKIHAALNNQIESLQNEKDIYAKERKLKDIYRKVLTCHDVMAAKRFDDLKHFEVVFLQRPLSGFMLKPVSAPSQALFNAPSQGLSKKASPSLTALSVFFPPAAAIAAGVVKAMAGHALSGAALGGVVFGGGAVVTTVATVASASVDGIIRESRSSEPDQSSDQGTTISQMRAALAKAKAERDKAQQPELQSPVSNNAEVKNPEPAQEGGVPESKGNPYSNAIATNSELGGHQPFAPAQHMLADSSDQAQKNDSSGLNPS
ncbi:MAG: hypothetical protein EBX40_06975 [Gammaproteobacteria bacterium]|nr:hypothetical protein [Gammaproteobacteria bacterium]